MKRKGFTLIELLAVIIILAIIALIAVPIIMGIINNARERARQASVRGFASALRLSRSEFMLENRIQPNFDELQDLNINISGEEVKCKCVNYGETGVVLYECTVGNDKTIYHYESGVVFSDNPTDFGSCGVLVTDKVEPAIVLAAGNLTTSTIQVHANVTTVGPSGLPSEPYSFDGGNTWQSSPTFTLTGLTRDTEHNIKVIVRARNGERAEYTITARTADITVSHSLNPTPPTSATTVRITLNVSNWGAPGVGTITHTAASGITRINDTTYDITERGTYSFVIRNTEGVEITHSVTINNVLLPLLRDLVIARPETVNEPTTSVNWRYQGGNPNNWVTFNGEPWRIIGVFGSNTHGQSENLVKIVRHQSIGNMRIGTSNNWATSSLREHLNGTYFNSLNATSRSMIQNVTWRLGSISSMEHPTQGFYDSERGTVAPTPAIPVTATGNIGLIYPSDYGFSGPTSTCPRNLTPLAFNSSPQCRDSAWLWMGEGGWTLTPLRVIGNTNDGNSWHILHNGNLNATPTINTLPVRPSLYLRWDVGVIGGNGSQANPFQISL